MTGDIVIRLEDGRGVVVEAATEAVISAELLAEIALGRGNDAAVDYGTGHGGVLVLGVEGMGAGRVTYEVGELDAATSTYPLRLIDKT